MPDATTGPAPGLQQTDRTIAVQPREIKEAVFRALCAAGADPVEAQEGALAVVRAESETRSGLSLLHQLLDADWDTPAQGAAAQMVSWAAGSIRDVDSTRQPPLRTALQLLDLACDTRTAEVSIVRTRGEHIPALLWNDLLLRRTASLQCSIIIATSSRAETPDDEYSTDYLTARSGVLTATPAPASEEITALLTHLAAGDSIVIVVQPDPEHTDPAVTSLPPKSLKVRAQEWQTMYQLSRKFLVPDA